MFTGNFSIKRGKRQDYLDRCIAIFITTNSQLARLSTLFFNEQYGHANASICMGDHVFTSLVWMKSVKKTANLPKDRLVANCYSALLPSDSLWAAYIKEVNRLKDKGEISEHDYHVLIHGMAARDQLMDHAFSSDDNMFGSVDVILDKAKKTYTEELGSKLEKVEKKIEIQSANIERFISLISSGVYRTVIIFVIGLWSFLLIYALIYTTPDSISALTNFTIKSISFLVLIAVTLLNLIFGFKLVDICKYLASKCSNHAESKLRLLIDKK